MDLRSGFELGAWTVYPLEGKLVGGDHERRLQPKSMDVLICLAENDGTVVERDYLLRRVWGNRAISDEPLTRCISELRRALGDTRTEPEYIYTIPKRGYKLLKSVSSISQSGGGPDDKTISAATSISPRSRRIGVALATAIVFVIFLAWVLIEGERSEIARDAVSNDGPAVAVLPFENISADREQEYFADGVSEELLNALTQIPELRVISRSSAFFYKNNSTDMRTIAEMLGVTHVLEGSVRRSGDQVRISAQLIEARTDTQLWSETYERTLDDIFAIQDDIATRVVEELKIRLIEVIRTGESIEPEAYALVLQARYLGRQLTPESMATAVDLYNDAIDIDPFYAAPWAGLAIQYTNQAGQGLRPIDESYELARDAANRALSLDPTNELAHRSLARIARTYDRDLPSAVHHDQLAFSLNPASTSATFGAAATAAALGRLDLAIALAEYAVELDPISAIGFANLGLYYFRHGQQDKAIDAHRTVLSLSPELLGGQFILGLAQLMNGETEAALQSMRMELDEGWRLLGQAIVDCALNHRADAEERFAELTDKFALDSAYNIAYVAAYCGWPDRAFEWLDRAAAQNDPGLTDIVVEPLFKNIHEDPRWPLFLDSIGRSPEQLAAIEFNVTPPE